MKKVVVIKVGGAILENEESLCRLLDDFAALPGNKDRYIKCLLNKNR